MNFWLSILSLFPTVSAPPRDKFSAPKSQADEFIELSEQVRSCVAGQRHLLRVSWFAVISDWFGKIENLR